MFEKFVRATVQLIPNSAYKLNFSCINGVAVANRSLNVPLTSRYANGSEFVNGDALMFSLAQDDSLLPGFYPFNDPNGNPVALAGGKGKGTVGDVEQRGGGETPQSPALMQQRQSNAAMASSEPAVATMPIQVNWINGIWMSESITIVLDPGYPSLSAGTSIYFQCSYNPDGMLVADYVALSAGNCGDPA
jgi:hypothetical protein